MRYGEACGVIQFQVELLPSIYLELLDMESYLEFYGRYGEEVWGVMRSYYYYLDL